MKKLLALNLLLMIISKISLGQTTTGQSKTDGTTNKLMVTITSSSSKKTDKTKKFSEIVSTASDTNITGSIAKSSILAISIKNGAISLITKKDSTITLTIASGSNETSTKDSIIIDTIKRNSIITVTTKKDSAIIRLTISKDLSIKNTLKKDTGSFTFLNAFNFDFTGQLKSNYVGQVSILKTYPVSWWIFKKPIGFNVGIMKIGYNGTNQDSSSNYYKNYKIENILIHPLDSIKVGTKYLRQQNKYSISTSNTVWSFYIQPLFQLNENSANRIFLHFHVELLVNDWVATANIKTIQTDTSVINASNVHTISLRPNIGNQTIYRSTLLNGYFGTGLTFDLKVSDNIRFFAQPTIGYTTNQPNYASINVNSDISNISNLINVSGGKLFYLARANLEITFTKSLTAVLGTDIRGLLPQYPPLYAAYVGVKLDVNAIKELVAPTK